MLVANCVTGVAAKMAIQWRDKGDARTSVASVFSNPSKSSNTRPKTACPRVGVMIVGGGGGGTTGTVVVVVVVVATIMGGAGGAEAKGSKVGSGMATMDGTGTKK